ncbi:uncharacterized protein LOC121774428 [Salvia splendens]|uniref:uncharacterized protein LOC121774428 n=1 Tax=Salvia splendens TaxID=180675 RepID=UPI001C2545E2|nr:uncharacterized protein LOC121774428 [Salvia splendens]
MDLILRSDEDYFDSDSSSSGEEAETSKVDYDMLTVMYILLSVVYVPKQCLEGADAQILLNEIRRKKQLCGVFTYEYEVLYDICSVYGPVTFAAGLLSKENAYTFSWLFNQFVTCMSVAPKLIVTDQDLGMKVAIEEVLVNTRHRWCMWHFMNKVADKLPKNMLGSEELKKELNACVWSELIEPGAFEETWHAIKERYGLANNDWYSKSRANLMQFYMNYNHALEAQRSNSAKLEYYDSTKVPILRIELEIEKHATTIYSGSAYNAIQEVIVYFVKLIPEKLHGGRWLKSQFVKPIHGGFCDDQEIHLTVEKKKIAFKNLYTLFIETSQSIEGNIDQINAFAAIIEEGKKQLLGEGVVLSSTEKKALIENFYGSQVPNFIEVHPPDVISTKGSGSRKKSKKESAMKLAMKPGRKCRNCHEIGHHDSRNCKKVNEKANQRQ